MEQVSTMLILYIRFIKHSGLRIHNVRLYELGYIYVSGVNQGELGGRVHPRFS